MNDPVDVFQGVITYFYLGGFLFVFSWLGEELTTEVSIISHLELSFTFNLSLLPSTTLHFIFNVCLVAEDETYAFAFPCYMHTCYHYPIMIYNYHTILYTVHLRSILS